MVNSLQLQVPLLTFFLVTIVIGVHVVRRIHGKVRNYFVAGNILPFWLIVLTITGQTIDVGGTSEKNMLQEINRLVKSDVRYVLMLSVVKHECTSYHTHI